METNHDRTRDEWIALRCKLGEPAAFADLVGVMERPLLYYVTRLVGDENAAFDVLQDVWLKAFRTIRKLDDPRSLRPWLYRIARGRAIDGLRRSSSRARAERGKAEQVPEGAGDEPTFDDEDAASIHRGLDTLSPKHREVLILYFLDDLSVAEIASVVGEPVGTIKSRIYYAKQSLRQELTRNRHEHSR